ncbi:MAG: transposase, partial [Phycisphaerae bacterium]
MPNIKIKRALIAVYDKTGIADFARILVEEFAIELISTGGTARHLKEAGLAVTLVEEITGFPEMLDGRVKTLHPKIHAAILADRDNPEHMRQLAEQDIQPIDMVVVNLYPFEKTVARPDCTLDEAIEMIDIGGPCLLRAAAKNHRHVLCVISKRRYKTVVEALRAEHPGQELRAMALWGANYVFKVLANYNLHIFQFLVWHLATEGSDPTDPTEFSQEQIDAIRHPMFLPSVYAPDPMRYGENPHQRSQFFSEHTGREDLLDRAFEGRYDSDKALSFNNAVDADAALNLCAELTRASRDLQKASQRKEEPRASARAAVRSPTQPDHEEVLLPPEHNIPCHLLTWTTYGTWLPGDDRGFVSRTPAAAGGHEIRNEPGTSYDAGRRDLTESARKRMKGKPVFLNPQHARVIHDAFIEVAINHDIAMLAFSIMPDHVHLICQDSERSGSDLLQLFKGVSSRSLGQRFKLVESPRWWTESGSKRFIRKRDDPQAAIDYVCNQARPLCIRCFDASRNKDVFPDSGAARTEVRGSSDASSIVGRSCSCFIKHTNACGVGIADDPIEAYRRAYLGDPNAAMGGILAVNHSVDAAFADAVMDSLGQWGKAAGAGAFFVEVWLAPSFEDAAVEVIRTAKKWGQRVRLLTVGDLNQTP